MQAVWVVGLERQYGKDMDHKVLVLDLDGTLTNSQKKITQATKQSIQEILKKGHKVVLASGRPTPGMRGCEKDLELQQYGGYLLSFNGASVIDCITGEVIYQRTLPREVIPGVYEFAKEHGCGLITYQDEEIISAFPADQYMILDSKVCGMNVKQVENFVDYIDFEVNKCLLSVNPDLADEYVKILSAKYGDIVSIYRSEAFYIEIMPLNVDKATSLDKMLPIIGGTRENTICCGDSFNDISMVRYAGIGVAMGNAQQRLKDVADYITDTNDNDGLVRVIDKFILI